MINGRYIEMLLRTVDELPDIEKPVLLDAFSSTGYPGARDIDFSSHTVRDMPENLSGCDRSVQSYRG
jgi:hypothetical protein